MIDVMHTDVYCDNNYRSWHVYIYMDIVIADTYL